MTDDEPKSRCLSDLFGLGKTQAQLDFVDVPLTTDTELFVDPFAIGNGTGVWCYEASQTLVAFFNELVTLVVDGRQAEVIAKLSFLKEPNETHLGFSKGKPKGAGM